MDAYSDGDQKIFLAKDPPVIAARSDQNQIAGSANALNHFPF